ncbi:hydroquinone glucosyltransferase-like [Mangifera indica]|uniref:hydroquinone glucosyltransferase-like n=1 Tax=Mangifera indica TaxID=29780 RepID=UPI001CFA7117|nr:hydroquinone glucosyltransferase-like [Mangifera indica]
MEEVKPHIAVVPSPGLGHLIPFIELAKQIVRHHNFCFTIIICTSGPPSKALISSLENLPDSINHVFLPPVSFDDLPSDIAIQAKISLTTTRSLSFIRDTLRSLLSIARLVALFVDIFSTDAIDVANEFKISPYVFFTSAHFTLSLILSVPKLDEMVTGDFRDMSEPVKIPGCSVPIHAIDLPRPFQDRKNDAYKWLLHHSKRLLSVEGILVNSFLEMGPEVVNALQEPGKPKVYLVGPVIRSSSSSGISDESDCLKWLDDQPTDSVLFVSFGSGGTLSHSQQIELAFGLEMSGQKFLWVVRSPDNSSAHGSYFSGQSNLEPFGFLPEGFLERTKAQGLVVPSWAPQIEVLSHRSTGGFLSHCGWNSTLESVVHGVPFITWPLFAEQRLNALMLCEDLEVGLRPEADENGLVRREEISKIVKRLLQGEEGLRIRQRMNILKDAAVKALTEGGSSTKPQSEFVLKLKNKINTEETV